MFDAKDRVIILAASLCGYCDSADHEALEDDDVRERWLEGLDSVKERLGEAIDTLHGDKPAPTQLQSPETTPNDKSFIAGCPYPKSIEDPISSLRPKTFEA